MIDEAQKNITALSGQVVSLQEILSDKQSRGAFGQERMEAIIADQLPPSHYDFQFTLSNGKRPDCIIRLPNVKAVIVIDSKFPLEAFEALRGLPERRGAQGRRRPSQGRRAEACEGHRREISDPRRDPDAGDHVRALGIDLCRALHLVSRCGAAGPARAGRHHVSPHVFMLAINTIQTLMRDARMREQAGLIQKEVGQLAKDVKLAGRRDRQTAAPHGSGRWRHQGYPDARRTDRLAIPEDRKGGAVRAPRTRPRRCRGRDAYNDRRALNAALSVPSSR